MFLKIMMTQNVIQNTRVHGLTNNGVGSIEVLLQMSETSHEEFLCGCVKCVELF